MSRSKHLPARAAGRVAGSGTESERRWIRLPTGCSVGSEHFVLGIGRPRSDIVGRPAPDRYLQRGERGDPLGTPIIASPWNRTNPSFAGENQVFLRVDSHFFLGLDTDSGMVLKLRFAKAHSGPPGPTHSPGCTGHGAKSNDGHRQVSMSCSVNKKLGR